MVCYQNTWSPLFSVDSTTRRSVPFPHSPFLPQARTSTDMGHWLGMLLSQTGSKTDPEELTYDYVCADRISSIVTAAKTSL